MGTRARKERKKTGEPFERAPKDATPLIRRRLFLEKSWPAQKRELEARRLETSTKTQIEIISNRRKAQKGEL